MGKIFNTLNTFFVDTDLPQTWNTLLYIDTITWKDWYGIGDAIFSLPAIQVLSERYLLDVLTSPSRAVIFQWQKKINHIFTDKKHIDSSYDMLFLLHKSSAKYKFIVRRFWFDGMRRTFASNYAAQYYTQKKQNHIQIINKEIATLFLDDNIVSTTPHINIAEEWLQFWRNILAQSSWTKKIIFSVWYKDPKKNYEKLYHTIQLIAQQYTDYTFFLLWDESGKEQEKYIHESNVIKCSWLFSLEQSFWVIAASDGIIWIDGWLTNAWIWLWKHTFMVFNIIDAEDIIPPHYNKVTTVDVWCAKKCTYTMNDTSCHHLVHAQCLQTLSSVWLYNQMASWLDKTFLSV